MVDSSGFASRRADERVPTAAVDAALAFFRALAHGDRMRMAAALIERELGLDELAETVRLPVSTVSRNLGQLRQLGLVVERQDEAGPRYAFDPSALNLLKRTVLGGQRQRTEVEAGDQWERKVLRDFLDGDRLKSIPSQAKKRAVVLRWLAGKFEPGERYPEREVNERLARHHPDFATLRRELVDSRLMRREGGVYWREDGPTMDTAVGGS